MGLSHRSRYETDSEGQPKHEQKQFFQSVDYRMILVLVGCLFLYSMFENIRLHHLSFDFKITENIGFSVGFVNEKHNDYEDYKK